MKTSPGEVLVKKYIIPSGLTFSAFAKALQFSDNGLKEIVEGKKMTRRFVKKLSFYTNTLPEFWHTLQAEYNFERFFKQKAKRPVIVPIKKKELKTFTQEMEPQVIEGTPGYLLFKNYIEPNQFCIYRVASDLRMQQIVLIRILTGKKRINYQTAKKLSSAVNIDPSTWIKSQTQLDINTFLNTKKNISRDIKSQLLNYQKDLPLREFKNLPNCIHPGILFREQFVNRLDMKRSDWSNLLGMADRDLSSLLSGKKEISLPVIIKLYHVFNTPIAFWLDTQIQYCSNFKYSICAKKNEVSIKKRKECPGEVLVNDFIRPMNWTIRAFSKHIGISEVKLGSIKHGNSIDFDIAIRIGEALDMDPWYWIKLQLDYSLKYHKAIPLKWYL